MTLSQLTLFVLSLLLVVAVVAYGRAKKGFEVIDLYFLMVALYFGVYSFIDAAINGAIGKSPSVIIATFIPIIFAMFITWLIYVLLPRKYRYPLSFRALIERWSRLDPRITLLLAILYVAFNAYVFGKYGILTYVGAEYEELNLSVPSWIGPVMTLMRGIGFTAYISLVVLLILRIRKLLSVYGLVMIVVSIALLLEGRRAVIELLIIGYLIWTIINNTQFYSFKRIHVGFLAAVLFLVASNLYQTYRNELLSLTARTEHAEVTSLSEAAINVDATVGNYRKRLAMWNFNYMITEKQLDEPFKLYYGSMAMQVVENSIPSVIDKNKKVILSDDMTSQLYGFYNTDYPTNNFSSLMTDFGLLMIVLAPIQIMAVMMIMAVSNYLLSSSHTLYLIITSLCIQFLLHIENSYGDIVILLRNIALIVCVVLGGRILVLMSASMLKTLSKSDTRVG